MRATIHRAAIVANYKDIWTIKRPRKSNFLGCIIKLKIRYENSNNGDVTGSTQNGSNNLNGADVVIWGKNQNNELYLTQDVFCTTIHELAHFSHRLFYNKNNPSGNFDQDVNQFILESWARCVQWKVTTDYYQSPWGPRGYKYGFQDWNLFMANSTTGAYTPVFIDLIDDFNQHNSNTNFEN